MTHNISPLQTQPLTGAGAHTRTRLHVLIACEESQAECAAFRALGHIAYSCDIQPCKPSGHPEWHIHGDVTPLFDGATKFKTQDGKPHQVCRWDLIIAHPPCTYLCKVSSVHLCRKTPAGVVINEQRLAQMQDGAAFFRRCLSAPAPYVAVENPIPMARAGLPRPSFYAQPCWFGVKYTKKTLYWVRNLPPLMPTVEHPNPKEFVKASRGKYRSRTFPQMAKAIAHQWSQFILDELNHRHSLAR